MEKILIQAILNCNTWKTTYYKKEDAKKNKRINKKEFFRLYESKNVEILPPLTREKN